MNAKNILKKLIETPSYLDNQTNEKQIGQWVYDFLKANTSLKIKKQFLDAKRFNLVCGNLTNPTVLITGHLDTVQPNQNWATDPLKPIFKGNKIYGLGASDMKGSLAAVLSLANKLNNPQIMYLFYVDEEYDFLGMKKFVREYQDKIAPKLIISLDGENCQIGNACRGLVEIKIEVQGKSGHAANPQSGINAITQSQLIIAKLKKWLVNFSSSELGESTLNVAYIQGGTKTKDGQISGEGNIIANYCQYVLEIRVAKQNLTAKAIKNFLLYQAQKMGLKITNLTTRHDLGAWLTPQNQLQEVLSLATKKTWSNPQKEGYIDIQMLWKTFNQVPTFSFGCGESEVAHQANEYVKVSSLDTAEKFYRQLLAWIENGMMQKRKNE